MSDPGHIAGPVVIPNAIQMRFRWNLMDGKVAHNVMYGQVGGGFVPTAVIAENLRTAIAGAGTWTALAAYLAPTTSLAGVDLLDVRSSGNAIVSSTGAALPGTSASGAMPDEVCACLTLRTAKTGQSNRGRLFIPGFASNAMGAGGIILAATVTALSNFGAALPGLFLGQSITLSIGNPARNAYVSAKTGRSFGPRAAGLVPVTSVLCRDNHWDTQRRRGLGR